jgi:hypothetical protein
MNTSLESEMDALDNLFEDVDIFVDSEESSLWDKLITQIMEGNVIPVIGADMLLDKEDLHAAVLNKISKSLGVHKPMSSFDELIRNKDFRFAGSDKERDPDVIYTYVSQLFSKLILPPSKRLERLLATRKFPFVITTSYTPIVEQAMKNLYGSDNVQVKKFSNNPSKNNDISSEDLKTPTVYYMFGKYGSGSHQFALTDLDMLSFVSSWFSDPPKGWCNALKNKYLLILGDVHNNWLFRFILYAMRKSGDTRVINTETGLGPGVYAHDCAALDESLLGFLERIHVDRMQCTSDVIDKILVRLEQREEEDKRKFDLPDKNLDVFISYSRSDAEIAQKLYEKLTEQGKRVWYDKYDISAGGEFMDEIHGAIRTAKFFVPILTSNIIKERNDPHVYRTEWQWAIDVAAQLGRTYLIPVAHQEVDFYKASIPEKLQQKNAILYTCIEDVAKAADQIVKTMNQI